MLFSTVAISALTVLISSVDALSLHQNTHNAHVPAHANRAHSHHKRSEEGHATWYDVGLGACGGHNSPGDYVVALNHAQYGSGYPGPQCGRQMEIRANGKSAVATVVDECPGCPYGCVDMSKGLFQHFNDLG
ncbi:hypothetical protein FRB99_003913, partial [Tulasnella sp. 403]